MNDKKTITITIEEYNLLFEKQKQVDELKERAKIDLENERNWGKIQTKQAIKDTAKEILDEVSKHFGGAWLVELYKRYGLEVE